MVDDTSKIINGQNSSQRRRVLPVDSNVLLSVALRPRKFAKFCVQVCGLFAALF
jgi:hypothetical protein